MKKKSSTMQIVWLIQKNLSKNWNRPFQTDLSRPFQIETDLSRPFKANVPAQKKTIYPWYGEYLLNHYFTKDISEKTDDPRYKVAQYRKQISLKNLEDAPHTPDLNWVKLYDIWLIMFDPTNIVNSATYPENFRLFSD